MTILSLKNYIYLNGLYNRVEYEWIEVTAFGYPYAFILPSESELRIMSECSDSGLNGEQNDMVRSLGLIPICLLLEIYEALFKDYKPGLILEIFFFDYKPKPKEK